MQDISFFQNHPISTPTPQKWLIGPLRLSQIISMAGTLNFLAGKQSEIVHIVENVSSINEIESKYRCVRVRDIQQDIDFSACFVKGKPLNEAMMKTIHSSRICHFLFGQLKMRNSGVSRDIQK